jgi:hypothetical protein
MALECSLISIWEIALKTIFGFLPAILLGSTMLAGCATDGDSTAKWAADKEKQVVTGSNIPRKDKGVVNVRTASKDELERIQSTSTASPVAAPQ